MAIHNLSNIYILMLNVSILGSSGFIGKHLSQLLFKNSDLNLRLFGRRNVNSFNQPMPYFQIDLNNSDQIREYLKETDVLYYLISDSIPLTNWNNPILEVKNNLLPFIKTMDILSTEKLKKVVFVSSAGTIYGSSKTHLSESSSVNPFSPYGIIKFCMENFLNYYDKRFGVKYDIFRVSNVFGPGQNISKGLGIINTFLEKIVSDRQIFIYGNGQSVRNYIYISDVVDILSLSLNSLSSSHVFNLSSNDNISINELVKIIKSLVNEEFNIIYKEARQSDNPCIFLDNNKLKNHFNGFVFTQLTDGILETYNFIKSNI